MHRLSDLPDPHAVVVIAPGLTPGSPTVSTVVNGRIARMIAWLLDRRTQIEAIRGSVEFNFGGIGLRAELRESTTFGNVEPSNFSAPPAPPWQVATDTLIRASDEIGEDPDKPAEASDP